MITWHDKSINDILQNFGGSLKGLNDEDVKKRLDDYGPNKLPESKGRSIFSIFLSQYTNPLILLLIFAFAVTIWLGEHIDAFAIGLIVVLNSLIGFYEEYKAEVQIESLKHIVKKKSTVRRNEKLLEINSEELVPGDILILNTGDKVTADARLIESKSLQIDESLLTGESIPTNKNTDQVDGKIHILDAPNIVFSGTLVTNGRAESIVVSTGEDTQIGRIVDKVQNEDKEKTPLQKNIEHLGNWIGKLAVALVIPIFIIGVWQGREIFEIFELAVSLAVSAVPEGLPIIITVTLALGINRMVKSRALVRKLPSVEVLGSVDVICTDKTGTITENKMTVNNISLENENIENFEKLLYVSILCNDATTEIGDPTEKALVYLSENAKNWNYKENLDVDLIRSKFERTSEIPFSSEYKYMVTSNKDFGLSIKGATEEILNFCNISQEKKSEILKKNEELAQNGFRVLAFAYSKNNSEDLNQSNLANFEYLGLISMQDPPRKDVHDAIEKCKNAGIRVKMITGDHALTAKSIAEQVGINNSEVLTGLDLNKISDDELKKVVENVDIYARVTSEDKLRILKALQQNGHVVAMGGDGVNDTPAIKKAELGFSVGSGTDLAKEVSDMILLDDSFAIIPKAIHEGRSIYSNIRNFIKLLLSLNFDEILIVLTAIILKTPLVFLPIHILWINLLSDGLPAIALAGDQKGEEIMKRKPRKSNSSIIKGVLPFIIFAAICDFSLSAILFSLEYPWWNDLGYEHLLDYARSVVFVKAVLFELALVFSVRTQKFAFGKEFFSNKYLLLAVGISFSMLIAAIYIPFLNSIFKIVPIQFFDWLLILVLVGFSFMILEFFKIWYYKDKDF